MFSLIISIISIALVAALAAATVYFGGAAFNKGGAGADASTFINGAQQIAGAFTLAETDGYTVSTIAALADGTATDGEIYLSQVPSYKGTALTLDATETNYVTLQTGISVNICEEINDRAVGKDGTNPTAIGGLFGCVQGATATDPNTAFYKVK